MDLKIYDLNNFTNGTSIQRRHFCQGLLESFKKYGFATVINYEISKHLVKEVFSCSAMFFDLSDEDKNVAAHPPRANPHRGYSHVGMEKSSAVSGYEKGNVVDLKQFNCKESFDQGDSQDTLYPNIWPNESTIPGFRATMEKYFDSCHSQLLVMLEALSESLSLPVDYFSHMHSRREHELRLLHYPEVSISELRSGSKIRISEHTDFGSISLLFQDDVGGLEIEDQTEPGLFHPLECEPGVMIVNLGDSLQRWTNDALKSVNHRVTIPRTLQDTKEGIIAKRYSIAFFGKPNRDVSVAALPQFVSDGMPSRYQQMTASEYNQAKLLRTY